MPILGIPRIPPNTMDSNSNADGNSICAVALESREHIAQLGISSAATDESGINNVKYEDILKLSGNAAGLFIGGEQENVQADVIQNDPHSEISPAVDPHPQFGDPPRQQRVAVDPIAVCVARSEGILEAAHPGTASSLAYTSAVSQQGDDEAPVEFGVIPERTTQDSLNLRSFSGAQSATAIINEMDKGHYENVDRCSAETSKGRQTTDNLDEMKDKSPERIASVTPMGQSQAPSVSSMTSGPPASLRLGVPLPFPGTLASLPPVLRERIKRANSPGSGTFQQSPSSPNLKPEPQPKSPLDPAETASTRSSVTGGQRCSYCQELLGPGAAMVIESLNLMFHVDCFKCFHCGAALSSGPAGTDVRVKTGKLACAGCFGVP
jgi:F-box protein 20